MFLRFSEDKKFGGEPYEKTFIAQIDKEESGFACVCAGGAASAGIVYIE